MEQEIIDLFKKISEIPRKSGHEEQVSRFLLAELQSYGLQAERDHYGNVIAEKPAAAGYESVPRTILQAHMDMVCVAADGTKYDPLRDAIKVRQDNEYVFAEQTSLGADDGIGVAVILFLLRHSFVHGPLRAIFTVDEEDGMTGARNLAASYLDGKYFINCDSEDVDAVTMSSAGSVNMDFSKKVIWQQPKYKTALAIAVRGLSGGHSGMDIQSGRANALQLMGLFISRLQQQGISFELAWLRGGIARNSIPAQAEAVIVVECTQVTAIHAVREELARYLQDMHGNSDPAAAIAIEPTEVPVQVMDNSSMRGLSQLLVLLHTGVYSLEHGAAGAVKSSLNIGFAMVLEDEIILKVLPRSSVDDDIEAFKWKGDQIATVTGFTLAISSQLPAWPACQESFLADVVSCEFRQLTGLSMKKDYIHAGLECSWFYQKNPSLDMVSLGPTVTGVHSPEEKLHLSTLGIHVQTVKNTLTVLAESGR